jgi:hypothetical protein
MKKTFYSVLILMALVSTNAIAGIIGLVSSHAGSNVTIKGATVNGQPAIQVQIPNSPDCPVNLYRYSTDSEFPIFNEAEDINKNSDDTKTMAFGVWYDRDCYLNSSKTTPINLVRNFDINREIFSKTIFSKFKKSFDTGHLKISLCIQEFAPGDYEQSQICSTPLSKDDTTTSIVAYHSNFVTPKPVNLALTSPKPVKLDFSISRDYLGPSLEAGQSFVKSPTLSGDMASFVLDVNAGNSETWSFDNGGVRYDYYFLDGKLVKISDVKSAMKKGARSYCGMTFLVPKNLIGTTQINVKGGHSANVSGGGGGCDFCDGNYGSDGKGQFQSNDPDLDRRNFWKSSIALSDLDNGSESEVQLLNLYCSTENGNWDSKSVGATADVVYRHLRINDQPLLQFYSDYPGFQANP